MVNNKAAPILEANNKVVSSVDNNKEA
jgi:hypothetical protein